jgi:23S rRNA (cytosine1962-C5)-methyltransferase
MEKKLLRILDTKAAEHFPWIKKKALAKESLDHLHLMDDGECVELRGNTLKYFAYWSKFENLFKVYSSTTFDIVKSFDQALSTAINHRSRLNLSFENIRVLFSESDEFPGLTIDKYGDIAVLLLSSSALLKYVDDFARILTNRLPCAQIVTKGGKKFSSLKASQNEIVAIITEHDIKYFVDIVNGHKSGFYLDQRRNRLLMRNFVTKKAKVLDLFCYSGGFGLNLAAAGAEYVCFVDETSIAQEQLAETLKLNKFAAKTEVIKANAFEFVKNCHEKFNIIVADPPSLTSNWQDLPQAKIALKNLLKSCVKLLLPKGVLIFFSCSYHLSLQHLTEIVSQISKEIGRKAYVLEHFFQDLDHPIVASFPPSEYLKGLAVLID